MTDLRHGSDPHTWLFTTFDLDQKFLARSPTVVIFIGAIGGFVRAGIIGFFVGAVVLAVGHNLLKWWLENEPETAQS